MPATHARLFQPSAAKRWLACTASAELHARLEERFGSPESPFAADGTKAHALGELKIRHAVWRADKMTAAKHGAMSEAERAIYPGINRSRYLAQRKDLGDVPDEMERATDTYCDVVMERLEAHTGGRLFLEQRYNMSGWAENCFGTADCTIISDDLLEVIDFKYGVTDGQGKSGVPVNAEGNPQLRLYALGAVQRFSALYDFRAVRLSIVQPRLDSVTREALPLDELLRWGETTVRPAAEAILSGKGSFCPGEHCHYCAAKAVCAARAAEALRIFDYGLQGSGELSEEQIVELLPKLDAAEEWIKDIRAYTEDRALRGERIPGYKLVRGRRPNRNWTDDEEVRAQLLRSGYGPEQFEVRKLRTVSDLEKTLGAKAFRALLGPLVRQGEGRLQLVPESDPRPEYNSADAAFGDMTNTENETTERTEHHG